MAKGILVMDIPDSCYKCPLFSDHYLDMCCRGLSNRTIDYPYPKDFRQKWCPLKEIPEKSYTGNSDYYQWGDWEDGWNACIDGLLDE